MWKPLKYHLTKDGRRVLFVQNENTRVLRKQNFKLFDIPTYNENPKYIIEMGNPARQPQVGDIVADIENTSIMFGEVVGHTKNSFRVRTRSGLEDIWKQPHIVHHNIIGMYERDTEGFVNQSIIPIRTMEEFNLACEFFAELANERYFSQPPIENLSPDTILEIHHSMFGGIAPWGGSFRNRSILVGRADYEAPPYEDVPSMMVQFCKDYSKHLEVISLQDEFNSTVALELAKIYFEFCDIHPFMDGNGRISRFLILQALSSMDSLPLFRWDVVRRSSNRTDRAFEKIRKYRDFSKLSDIISRACGQPFPQYDTRLKSPSGLLNDQTQLESDE